MGVFEKYQRCVTLMFTWLTWLLIRTKMGQSAIVTIALVKVQEQNNSKNSYCETDQQKALTANAKWNLLASKLDKKLLSPNIHL